MTWRVDKNSEKMATTYDEKANANKYKYLYLSSFSNSIHKATPTAIRDAASKAGQSPTFIPESIESCPEVPWLTVNI